MKNMKRVFFWTVGISAFIVTAVYAARIIDDTLKIGNANSSSNKVLEFDSGDGAANASIFNENATPYELNLNNIRDFVFGRATTETATITYNNGAANPKLRYNQSTGKWQFSDNGSTFDDFDEPPLEISDVGRNRGSMDNVRFQAAGTSGAKITSADGTAFSASNPGLVAVKRTSDGGAVVCRFESDVQFDTAGLVGTAAADMLGQHGFPAGAAVTVEQSMVVHACNLDNNPANCFFAIGNVPRQFTPNSSNFISYIENNAVSQNWEQMFVIKSGISVASYQAKPCTPIGGLRMTKNASDEWAVADAVSDTVGTIDPMGTKANGFKTFQEGFWGAASGEQFRSMGAGTDMPEWADTVCGGSAPLMRHFENKYDLQVRTELLTTGCGTVTNGTSTDQMAIPIPFECNAGSYAPGSSTLAYDCGYATLNSVRKKISCECRPTEAAIRLYNATDNVALHGNDFANTGDDIAVTFRWTRKGL